MENLTECPSPSTCSISKLNNDILQNIFTKLPAQSFAFAACVNRGWNNICVRILSRPVIASAISLHSSLPVAITEVMDKVFAGPIKPHFAILSINPDFSLDQAHQIITGKLGATVPIITVEASGIIGRDAVSDQFHEVNFPERSMFGVSLTIGYVPGLKVDAIPLSLPVKVTSINKFVMDIRDYHASVSGCSAPKAIFMFGDSGTDMKPVLDKLDYCLPEQTVVAGNESCRFRYQSIVNLGNTPSHGTHRSKHEEPHGAVALVFASDRTMLNCPPKIDFHFAMGAGSTAVGPTYRVVSAKRRSRDFTTWLTAKREDEHEILDGQQMFETLDAEMNTVHQDLYIGVLKRRKISMGSEIAKPVTSLSYHLAKDGDEQYLYVDGLDIKTGDSFRFYVPDSKFALRSSGTLSENFGRLKPDEVIGGFIFSCCGRDTQFFNVPNVDSSPILDNFPSIPLSGMFCGGEIGRGPSSAGWSDAEEEQPTGRKCLHVYSTVYVLLCCE